MRLAILSFASTCATASCFLSGVDFGFAFLSSSSILVPKTQAFLHLEAAVRNLFVGELIRVDVGEVNGHVFVNNSGIGGAMQSKKQHEAATIADSSGAETAEPGSIGGRRQADTSVERVKLANDYTFVAEGDYHFFLIV